MKLSPENRDALLMQVHQTINDNITFALDKFKQEDSSSLEYYVLTEEEEMFINKIKNSKLLQNVIEKVLTRSLDDSFFKILCILDGVSEPLEKFGKKSDVLLIDMPQDFDDSYDFLHDHFDEAFDEWEKRKS